MTSNDPTPAESRTIPGLRSGGSAIEALTRPVAILVGHFGSGKSEIAVNLAFAFRNCGAAAVTLVDLDLVKPYLRCRLAKDDLESRGVHLVAPGGDRFYADLPILVPAARSVPRDGAVADSRIIFDVGGHDLGARALGSISGLFERQTADLLFVVNANRPFAEDLPAVRQVFDQVQTVARMQVTGLVANTHLLNETTAETVRGGIRAARELEAATGVPLRFCAVAHDVAAAFGGPAGTADGVPILCIERHIVPPFARLPAGARRRPGIV